MKKISIKSVEKIRQESDEAQKKIDEWVDKKSAEEKEETTNIKLSRLNVNIPYQLYKKLKELCIKEDVNITQKILQLLERELEKKL